MENQSLQHHGILGMKWGVRRYQTKDGKLTPAGKKRYNAEMEKLKAEEQTLKNKKRTQAKVDKLLKKRQELDDLRNEVSGKNTAGKSKTNTNPSDPKKPKSIKDMTDDELIAKINRLRLEQTLASLTPKETNKGEEFVNNVLKPIGQKAANKLGDTILDKVNKTMRDQFGLDVDEKELKKLQKEFNTVDLKKKIAEANAAIKKANGDESEYDRLKREADIAGFETRIRNNEKAKSDTAGSKAKKHDEDLDKFVKAFTIKPREVSKEIRDQGENYINDVIFDDLSHM